MPSLRRSRGVIDTVNDSQRQTQRTSRAREESGSEEERPRQRRRITRDADEDVDGSDDDADATQNGGGDVEFMVKDLVRLALASEYSRAPIRRTDISTKVLGPHGRTFRKVFDGAQEQLRSVFGMEMIELPVREKVTLAQRKAAAKSQSQQKSSGAWVLRTTLPAQFRVAELIPPSSAPTAESEAQYAALYTFVISLIMLSGGTLPEQRLERYMARVNINDTDPLANSIAISGVDRMEKLVKRMEKEGYIYKVKDNSGGDEVVEWLVGPRGKLEVGEHGCRGMVKGVFGEQEDQADFDKRLNRSLANAAVSKPAEPVTNGDNARRRVRNDANDDDENDDD